MTDQQLKDKETIDEFNISDLVSFGNYLLSDLRQEKISKEMKQSVTDADLCNWKAKETEECCTSSDIKEEHKQSDCCQH